MVKREVFTAGLLMIVLLSSLACAETWFVSQPKSIYSLGDMLQVTAGVSNTEEQLEAELRCMNESRKMFLQYISNRTNIEIEQLLIENFLMGIKGNCEVWLKYGGYEETSQEFLISENILLNIETNDQYFEPGKNMEIKGDAEKANGESLNGFYEIKFPEINYSRTGSVEDGNFIVNISLPEKMEAGNYLMNVSVYEKIEDEVLNKGESRMTVKIKQVPNEIDIALDNQDVTPGKNLSFKIMLYDQSGEIIEGEASYSIEDSKGEAIVKTLEEVGKTLLFFPNKNITSGYYKIKAYSSGIFGERQFYIEENEEAEFKIVNGTLIIKNIGNVVYDKAVQVNIGEIVEIINDQLQLGEEKRYEIIAPEGEYDVKITDGKVAIESSNIGLTTGRAISIRRVEEGFLERSKSFAWLFLILVLGMFIFVTTRRTIKGKFVLKDRLFGGKFREERKKGGVVRVKQTEKKAEPVIKKDAKIAEHSLVLNGKKYDTPMICLKIKNELSANAKLNLENILKIIYENKGIIYRTGEYIIPMFSPLMTSTFKNHVPAVKTALDLQKKLNEHNKKFKDKIDFGISVHNGEIVSQVHENKLKFTGVGNTIPMAKKISDISEKEVLLSKQIHEKTLAEIKANALKRDNLDLFTVRSVVDRDQNKMYIQEFLKRLEGGK